MKTKTERERSRKRRKFVTTDLLNSRTLIVGEPRSGKTVSATHDALGWKGDLRGYDGQKSHGQELIKHFNIPVRKIALHGFGFINLPRYQDESRNRRAVTMAEECLLASDPTASVRESPLIHETLSKGLRIIQMAGAAVWGLAYVYQPDHPNWHAIYERTDDEGRYWMDQWASMSRHQQRQELGPALRRAEVLLDPMFKRCIGKTEVRSMALIGYGAAYELVRTIFLWDLYDLCQKLEYEERNVLVILEEAETYGLLTDRLRKWMLSLPKQGLAVMAVVHALGYEEAELRTLMQIFNRKVIHRCSARVAEIMAEEVATAMWDPYSIHSTETRQRQRRTEDGGWLDYSEASHRYNSYHDQVVWWKQRLMTLEVGERVVLWDGVATVKKIPLPPQLPWGLSDIRAEERIERWTS